MSSSLKRIVICHAGNTEGFLDNALLLWGQCISKCYLDYHQNMSSEVFKSWFGNKLIPSLPKDRKTMIVLDNAKYQCRLMEKTPSLKVRKNGMIEFMNEWYDWINLQSLQHESVIEKLGKLMYHVS